MLHQPIGPTLSAAAVAILCLAAPIEQGRAAPLGLSDTPLTLRTGVAPNLIVTLDDSGSMKRDYVPNGRNHDYEDDREFFAASYNGLAYDPDVTYEPAIDKDGNPLSTSYTNAYKDGFRRSSPIDLSAEDHDYDFDDDDDDDVKKGAVYTVFDESNDDCGATITDATEDDDCYDWHWVNDEDDEAKQNYANWYSFYRTRRLTTLTGVSRAFANVSDDMRVAWQGINRDKSITTLRPLTGSHREDLYNWLGNLYASGGTPLRRATQRAGKRYRTDKAYYNNPDVKSDGSAACRQNYHLLMTDGLWNGGASGSLGNVDDNDHTLPDDESYTPRPPYRDDHGNPTLADIAFQYWKDDLNSNLANDVPRFMPSLSGTDEENYWNPRNDPAIWQHMVNYTVGLGLSQSLNRANRRWGGSTYAGDFKNFEDGSEDWPRVGDSYEDKDNVYDLWHAAINSRGQFFNAENPQSLADAFQTILERIIERTASNTATASQSEDVRRGDSAYKAEYNSRGWTGELYSYVLKDDGTKGDVRWAASCALDGGSCAADGDNTYTGMTPSGRHIVTVASDGNPSTADGIAFKWNKLTSAQQADLNGNGNDALGQKRLSYLRGNHGDEERKGGILRDRSSRLGDIAHSSPTFVGPPVGARERFYEDPANGLTDAERSSYGQFKTDHAGRRQMIYAGANDGMLHAFYADHGKDDSGQEAFAFIPSTVFPHLADYTKPSYSHHPYVDATPTEGDVFFDGAWHTVLAGGLRGGGQGLYALDITDVPASSTTEADIAKKVLWEFTDEDDADLGYTYGKPRIVRLHNGEWAAVFGNGYNNTEGDGNASSSGNAVLYIVNIADGSLIRKIDTGVGRTDDPAGNNRPNGLATPTLADIDGDNVVDYAYAGDLFGNLWKFDLDNSKSKKWDVAYKPGGAKKPLFQAVKGSHQQPITAAPALRGHPSGHGYIVMFGTGKYIEASDATAKPTVESVYGIWDRDIGYAYFNRGHLLEQELTHEVAAGSRTGRLMSDNEIHWHEATKKTVPSSTSGEHLGWYFDLRLKGQKAKGEMMIQQPALDGNRLIFGTVTPNDDPCGTGALGRLMAVDFRDGSYPPGVPVFDANEDNLYDDNDTYDPDGTGKPLPLIDVTIGGDVKTTGEPSSLIDVGNGNVRDLDSGEKLQGESTALNRQSWRQIR